MLFSRRKLVLRVTTLIHCLPKKGDAEVPWAVLRKIGKVLYSMFWIAKQSEKRWPKTRSLYFGRTCGRPRVRCFSTGRIKQCRANSAKPKLGAATAEEKKDDEICGFRGDCKTKWHTNENDFWKIAGREKQAGNHALWNYGGKVIVSQKISKMLQMKSKWLRAHCLVIQASPVIEWRSPCDALHKLHCERKKNERAA